MIVDSSIKEEDLLVEEIVVCYPKSCFFLYRIVNLSFIKNHLSVRICKMSVVVSMPLLHIYNIKASKAVKKHGTFSLPLAC